MAASPTPTLIRQRQQELEARRLARGDVRSVRISPRIILEEGALIRIAGETGLFEFHSARVVDGEILWLEVTAARKGYPHHWRTFSADRFRSRKRISSEEAA